MIQERNVLLEPWFALYLGGKRIDEDMMKYVEEVQLEDEEDKIPILRVTIQDIDRVWVNDANIKKGSSIKADIGHRTNHRVMFDGVITTVEGDFQDSGIAKFVVAGLDKGGVSLQKTRDAKTWKNKKVSEVIQEMLKECGLKGTVQDTKVKLEYLAREQESNEDFIVRWRKRLNWRFYRLSDGTFYFGEKRKANVVKTLGYMTGGLEIKTFQPQYITLEQEDYTDITDPNNENAEQQIAKVVVPKIKSSSNNLRLPVGKA